MSEGQPSANGNMLRNVLLAIAGVFILASMYLFMDLRGRIDTLEAQQKTADEKLSATIESNHSASKASTEALAAKLGMTEKDLADRTLQLQRQQRAAEVRLAEQQKEQIGAVSTEVAGVKTEVGGVKTDVATTRSELQETKEKLERAIGDLGVQSGLIARTRDDLESLRAKGDRNYFEFTLEKGKKPTMLSTVSLELRKVDAKKGKYTLNVFADDRKIEKKDKTMNEPLQFYSGKDRSLYEVVVFNVDKNKISGYLSTPKTAAKTQ
jgi:hypothetical protein